MSTTTINQGSRAAYDFWLGLIEQLLNPFGTTPAANAASAIPQGLQFPVDQIAKAAAITQQLLEGMSRALAPALQAGLPNLLTQWAQLMATVPFGKTAQAGDAAPQHPFAPWMALVTNVTTMPFASLATAGMDSALPKAPLQAMSQAWTDMASRLTGASPEQFDTSFERTYGALSDGIGLGPTRKLYAAWRDAMSANLAQQDARTHYLSLLQAAYMQGFQRLLHALATKADAGERIQSVLALIRLWTTSTEQAVHETLQSEPGLGATMALLRADLAYRKKMRQVAGVLAEQFDIASRQDLDEAFREIQALKRELRAARAADVDDRPARAPARKSSVNKARKNNRATKSQNA